MLVALYCDFVVNSIVVAMFVVQINIINGCASNAYPMIIRTIKAASVMAGIAQIIIARASLTTIQNINIIVNIAGNIAISLMLICGCKSVDVAITAMAFGGVEVIIRKLRWWAMSEKIKHGTDLKKLNSNIMLMTQLSGLFGVVAGAWFWWVSGIEAIAIMNLVEALTMPLVRYVDIKCR